MLTVSDEIKIGKQNLFLQTSPAICYHCIKRTYNVTKKSIIAPKKSKYFQYDQASIFNNC